MKHRITILTLSRKWGGRCVAGYDHEDRRVVRLVSNVQGKALDTIHTAGIKLLDTIEAEVLESCPCEHQVENILVSPNFDLTVPGNTNIIEDFDFLASDGGNIFGDTRYKVVDVKNLAHSIELIRFTNMSLYVEDGKTKADFWVNGKLHRWYRVTDISHEGKFGTIETGYAIVTIPPL